MKAINKDFHNKLIDMGYMIPNTSGIYVFERVEKYAYIGQAKDLERRIIDHLKNYEQHIDLSLKDRKLHNLNTGDGEWDLTFTKVNINDLNEAERQTIKHYQDLGYVLYNITSGGQDSGKTDINARKPSKTYKQGVEYGKDKKLAEIRQFFEKYLDVCIKGTPNKIKEKKLQEFLEMMKND